MTTAAVTQIKIAALSEDFGLDLFKRKAGLIGLELLAKLPVYVRGPKKGKPKGFIVWIKTIRGGYDYAHGGGVRRPGESYGYKLAEDFDDAINYSDRCVRLSTNEEQLARARLWLAKADAKVNEAKAAIEGWGLSIERGEARSSLLVEDMRRMKGEAERELERELGTRAEVAQWLADLEAYEAVQNANK